MLAEIIDEYLLKREIEEAKEFEERLDSTGAVKFYPSSVGQCSRKIAYQMVGTPSQPLPARVLRILDNGTSMHSRYELLFAEMGILLASEVKISEESEDKAIAEFCRKYHISGRTDAIIRVDDEVYIVELKSASNNSFSRIRDSGEPKKEHYQQIQLYMHILGIHRGIILMENKDTQEIWEFPVHYDPEMATHILKTINMINESVANYMASVELGNYERPYIQLEHLFPDREYDKTSFECRYCDFRSICWQTNQQGLYA